MNLLRVFVPLVLVVPAAAQSADRYAGERPPVTVAGSRDAAPAAPVAAEQRLYRPAASLVSAEQAREIVERFRAAYERLGRPRLVLAVNRQLVDVESGLRLSARKERTVVKRTQAEGELAQAATGAGVQTQVQVNVGGTSSVGAAGQPVLTGPGSLTTEEVRAENTYESSRAPVPSLADRQTVRDLERLIGRPLRAGGASLADQRMVAQLIDDKPVDHFLAASDDVARKDREALTRTADAVVEVLISSRVLTTPGVAGDERYSVPDIQATIVRLKDGAILAQASSYDVVGKDRYAGAVVRTYDVNDIAEATALALMEDFAATAP